MADNSTATLTQEQQQAFEQMSLLAKGLGVDVPEQYTPEFGQEVRDAFIRLEAGIDRPIYRIDMDDAEYKRQEAIETLVENVHGGMAKYNMAVFNRHAAGFIEAIDGLDGNVAALETAASSSAPSSETSMPPSSDAASQNSEQSANSSSSSAPAGTQNQSFTPDAQTQAAMVHLCNDVFPSIGVQVSDPSNTQEFQACFDKVKEQLEGFVDLSGDDPAAALKAGLDKIAANEQYDKFSSMPSALVKPILGSLYGDVLPQPMLDDPKLLFALVDNRDAVVKSLSTVKASGVLEAGQVPSTTSDNSSDANADAGNTSEAGAGSSSDQSSSNQPSGDSSQDASGKPPEQPSDSKEDVREAMKAVEEMLLKPMGDYVANMGADVAGYAEKLIDFKPITDEEVNNDTFASEQFRLAMIGFKKLDGQENPNGAYDPSMKAGMITSIMEKDEFALIRQKIDEQINQGVTDQEQIKKNRQAVLDGLFSQMDVLYRDGQTNTEKAKNDTMYNRILMKAAEFIPDGMKEFLQDFFTNNDIGKMLGGFLGAMGIQVSLLWGEDLKSESEIVHEAAPAIQKSFEDNYAKAEGDTALEKVQAMRASAKEDLDGFAARFVTGALFKDMDSDFAQKAVDEAFADVEEVVANSSKISPEAMSELFADRLIKQANEFRNNPENAQGFDSTKALSEVETEQIRKQVEQAVKEYEITIAVKGQEQQLGMDVKEIDISFDKQRDFNKIIDRYAGDVPEKIYGVILGNKDDLEMSQDLSDIEGEKYFTPKGNAIIEELLIRATIHDHVESGGTVDQAFLDSLSATSDKYPDNPQYMPARELSMDNYKLIIQYMEDKGVAQADIDEFEKAVFEIGSNFRGTLPHDVNAGPEVKDSVLEHTVYGGQLKIEMFKPEPAPAPKEDPKPEPENKEEPAPAPKEDPKPEPENKEEPPAPARKLDMSDLPSIADGRQIGDPVHYRHLPVFDVNSREAGFLVQKLIERDPDLLKNSQAAGQNVLEHFFMDLRQDMNNGAGSGYIMLDLEEMGIEGSHPNFDGLMVHFGGGFDSLPEIRYYINNNDPNNPAPTHGLESLSSYRNRDLDEMGVYSSGMPKDLDLFYSVLDYKGNSLQHSPTASNGLLGINVVVPKNDGWGAEKAFDLVGKGENRRDYIESYSHRVSVHQGNVVAENIGYVQRNTPQAVQGSQNSGAARSEERVSDRSVQFNDKSGASCDNLKPEFENWGGRQSGGPLVRAGRMLGSQFQVFGWKKQQQEWNDCKNGTGDYADDRHASVEVDQAIRDIGADQFDPAANEAEFIPGMQNPSANAIGRTA